MARRGRGLCLPELSSSGCELLFNPFSVLFACECSYVTQYQDPRLLSILLEPSAPPKLRFHDLTFARFSDRSQELQP